MRNSRGSPTRRSGPRSKAKRIIERCPYHPEEVTELYLGSPMTVEGKADILAKAKAVNPKIKVFQAKRGNQGQISFEAV